MSESFSARRNAFSVHKASLDCQDTAEEPVRLGAASSDPTIEQIRAVQGTLNFLTALITFYGELIERDAPNDPGQAGSKSAALRS